MNRPADTEVLVVDDGSPNAIVSQTARSFADVRIVRLERPRGFCIAANQGLRAARGKFIELLNDDTQVTAGWAEAALASFADPHVGAVTPLVLSGVPGTVDPRIDSAGDGYDRGGFAWKIGRRQRPAGPFLQSCLVPGASGSSVFLRRSALEQTGLFPEHFGAYFEDVDLSRRLSAAGYAIRYEPASRVWHQGGSSYGGHRQRRLLEQQSCNEERVFWRNLSTLERWPTLGRHLAVLGGKALKRCREGTLLPFISGRCRAWRELVFSSMKDARLCPNLPPPGRS